MNKIAISAAVAIGLLGMAFVTRTDISILLPIGVVLITASGGLVYLSFYTWERKAGKERNALLMALSPGEMKSILALMADNLQAVGNTVVAHNNLTIEQLDRSRIILLQIQDLLQQVPQHFDQNSDKMRQALESAIDRMSQGVETAFSQITISIKLVSETLIQQHQSNIEVAASKQEEIAATLISELEDVRNSLRESSEMQSNSAEDAADNIKRTMKLTNDAIQDLQSSISRFGVKNAETMQKASDGYKQFEILLKTTLEQLTSISKQDYDLLKEFIE
ncbi:hypothetical protein [Paenibacillus sp. MER 99-2]|uniref:hypothetical protein n=1 Tax=Paenibacillus sp. MER 99-2 TaxID=2939572 RepID=UPI00203BB3E0|nr:hypothetical protein [Paenibacillus sp. MER 99-2]MCM3174401.1 hypothetical protein [Paenibacillus sp. MER 99-2]